MYIKFLLEPEGYNLIFVETDAQAISILNEELKPEIVISDIIMPDIDGIELCRIIKGSYPEIFPAEVGKIKALLVEDSPIKREILIHILKSDNEIDVIGYAPDSASTLKLLETAKPDVITMDINIPGDMNGFDLTQLILKTKSIPIVIISSLRTEANKREIEDAMSRRGALYFLVSPPSPWNQEFEKSAQEIIRIIKLITGKKMPPIETKTTTINNTHSVLKQDVTCSHAKIVVIGVSTGGPQILQRIFSRPSPSFQLPIIAVQHISKGFEEITVRLLSSSCPILVKLAEDNEIIKNGCIYIASADKITEIKNNRIVLMPFPENYTGYKPSVSHLFESAVSYGGNAIGIILTGMGSDGAAELKKMRDSGAVTIAQNKESCAVFGMPKEAINLGGVKYVMSPEEIIDYLNEVN